MDALQLVFSFVNAPLFATFLLGMFWKRTTGHGAFTGLISGTVGALLHHGLTLPADAVAGHPRRLDRRPPPLPQRHGAELLDRHLRLLDQPPRHHRRQPHDRPAPEPELVGLVYSLTPKPVEGHLSWYQKPATLGIAVLGMLVVLNLVFA